MTNERLEILDEARRLTTEDRNITYGSFVDNMKCFGALREWYAEWAGDKYSPEHDAAIDMALAKLARIASGATFHKDNYVDLVNYIGAAYECEVQDQTQPLIYDEGMDLTPGGINIFEDNILKHVRKNQGILGVTEE